MIRYVTPKQAEKCAQEIIDFLLEHEMWIDTRIYVNGCYYSCEGPDGHYHYGNTRDCVFKYTEADPRRYFDYVNEEHFISMSFEGPLYELLNYGYFYSNSAGEKLEEEFSKIFEKYGYYYQIGNAWNLTAYKI